MQQNSIIYYDAHCHLQDERLATWINDNRDSLGTGSIRRRVVNGTQPRDWDKVDKLGKRFESVIPSIGLHPWYVNTAEKKWKETFETYIDSGKYAVGEIGLDRWIEGHDIDIQTDAFLFQYRLACEKGLPISIHCLRAWGLLLELLEKEGSYEPGFLLHSYGGPKEMVESFVALGARFSFSSYFAHESKEKKREAFRAVPMDRLLVETDAPDMLGPECVQIELIKDESGKEINSPSNLILIYKYVAELRGLTVEAFAPVVAGNFRQLFRKWES